ncbi:MAG: T9SS type A sorting domain-containing protein [Candidatus Marinimicrobia bacterium]|nr:T9SS type A sorting domain-containing protein [Candidatus Neomarinimicrobiota bacterium]
MKYKMVYLLVVLFSFSLMWAVKQESPSRLTSNKVQLLIGGTNQVLSENPADFGSFPINDNQNTEEGLVRIKKNYPNDHSEGGTRSCPDGTFDCWDLSYMNEADSYYYLSSGGAGDTFAVVMTPAAPCIVQEVYHQWFSAGNAIAFGADYGAASELSANGDCYDIDGGSTNLSPIGTLRTNPTPNTITEYISDWSAGALLDIGGTFQVGDETDLANVPPFVIAFVKGGDLPQPLAMNNEVTGRTECFTWFGGPWNADDPGLWGPYNQIIENMVLVRVTYPWGAPIAAVTSNLSNTYATTDTRTVEVDLFDDVDDFGAGISDDDDIHLYVAVNDVEIQDLTVALNAFDISTDAAGNGLYGIDITYSGVEGDVVSWWVNSVDNDGLEAFGSTKSFTIKAPVNPDADLLLIDDGSSDYYLGGYELAAAADGYVYELWVCNDNGGIDGSVINHGWSNIVVFGWGNATVPVISTEVDPGYGDFIGVGGNLMLVDHDWFYGHALDSYPIDLTFVPGDPAYDWFGISGGSNDPDYDDNPDNGGAGDTNLVSLAVGLTDLATRPSIYTTTNWTDFMTPDVAVAVYEGLNTQEIVGVQYDNGANKTALFSFMADAAVDSLEDGTIYYKQEFYDFVSYFLAWFAPASPPLCEITSGPSGTVYGSDAQTVTANCSDVNGDAFAVDLEWSIDGGGSWSAVGMTDDGGGAYSGMVAGQAGGTDVEYRVSATDVDGTFSTPSGTYFVYAPSSEILFVLNNEFDPADYPGMYYFYDASTGGLWEWPDFWTGGINADLLSFYTTVFEITTTDTWEDFTDHYDIIHAWLNEGGKNYFLAGDETFGLINGTWGDEDFAPGSFFNDMGVAHSYNDLAAGGASVIDAVEGDFMSGVLYDGVMGLGDGSTVMYDPGYEIGTTNYLDGFEVTDDASAYLYDNASGFAVGVWKAWANGNKTVLLGLDPLSLNSDPTYEWWGATLEGPSKRALDWMYYETIEPCLLENGDANGDGSVNVLDVVLQVSVILGTSTITDPCEFSAADATDDGTINVLDVVWTVNKILNPRVVEIATSAVIDVVDNSATFTADGYVGAFQLTISHDAGATITLTENAFVADYATNGTSTTMVIVAPESNELFTVSGEFVIEEYLAASNVDYINVSLSVPSVYALKAAYPNPFNPTTTIGYDVPKTSDVKIVVYDMLGRQAAVLVNSSVEVGNYSVNWNASDLSSGMYLVRMTAGDFTSTQKIMLVK